MSLLITSRAGRAFNEIVSVAPYSQFSELMPSVNTETIDQVMESCGDQIDKFKALFQIFKNKEKFACRIAELIRCVNRRCFEDYGVWKLHVYLMDSSIGDEFRNTETPSLMKWINESGELELDMLMDLLEWDLFELEKEADSISGQEILEIFFENTPEDFRAVFNLMNQLNIYKRKTFAELLYSLKASGLETESASLIPLAFNFAQIGVSYGQITHLQKLSIPNDQIRTLNEAQIKQCLFLRAKFNGVDFDRYLSMVMQAKNPTYIELQYLISLEPDLCDFIREIPEDEPSEIWNNYVVRKSGWNRMYEGTDKDKQREYGMMMHHSVKVASVCLKEKQWNFDQLLEFLVMRRRHIAHCLYHPQRYDTGVVKDSNCTTYCEKDYQVLSDRLWDKYQQLTQTGQKLSYVLASERYPLLLFRAKMEGKLIELSTVDFRDTYIPGTTLNRNNCTKLTHTSPKNAVKIMQYVSSHLYPAAMEENDPVALVEKAGEIFWWICAAKPWFCGDPSIAETLFRTIWSFKGCQSPAWKEGIIPWVEATAELDPVAFSKKFSTFFDWS